MLTLDLTLPVGHVVTNATRRIKTLLKGLSETELSEVNRFIRQVQPIHQLEIDWNIRAEEILEAISQSSDLIQRGIRGVLADRAFHTFIARQLSNSGWTPIPVVGDKLYDALLSDDIGKVSVQVKLQRKKKGLPMTAKSRFFPGGDDYWAVEVQKTRKGHDSLGNPTRPYHFGDFDILAVNLQPSTGEWLRFRYTVARWLVPHPQDKTEIYKFQPVPQAPNHDWTDNFEKCVTWLRSGDMHTISCTSEP